MSDFSDDSVDDATGPAGAPGSTLMPDPHGVDASEADLPNIAIIDAWQTTESLEALRELVDVAALVGPAIARRAHLSHSELTALELLIKGTCGPVELARELGVTSAASSGIVDRLVGRGHVVRRPHPSDGRRTEVVITPSGRDEVLGHLMPMFVSLQELDRGMDPQEREIVARYLRGAIAAMRRLLGD